MQSVRKSLIGAAIAALGLGTFAIPALSGAAPGAPQGGTGGPVKCGSGSITWSPNNLWPPNHKMQTVTITYTGDKDDDDAMVAVTGWSDNETVDDVEMNGSGQPDAAGQTADVVPGAPGMGHDNEPVTTTAQVRAERSGRGTGRVYSLTVSCKETGPDEMGGTATATVAVPPISSGPVSL